MADVVQSAVHDYTTATGVSEGTGPLTIDGDTDTKWVTFYRQSGGGSSSRTIVSLHTLAASYLITRVVFKATCQAVTSSGASANVANCTAKVEVYREGAWETVSGSSISASAGGDANNSGSVDANLTGLNLTGVSMIKATGYVYARQDGGGGGQYAYSRLFELQAYASTGSYAGVI